MNTPSALLAKASKIVCGAIMPGHIAGKSQKLEGSRLLFIPICSIPEHAAQLQQNLKMLGSKIFICLPFYMT
jgi:hypothetical protein